MDILVVDDEISICRMLASMLTDQTHTVRTASNGQEALESMQNHPPDLVLTDIHMPHMDGLAFLRSVHTRYPDLPVIAMTGDHNLDIAVKAFRNGASDYLKKPIQRRELIERLEACRRHLLPR